MSTDSRWLAAAASLAARGRPLARPNPAVGAIIVSGGKVVGRGWTGAGGRPHAEARALEAARQGAHGATLYVTLEPCAHRSPRGPACADLVAASPLARCVIGCGDPDPRTAGAGIERIRAAGIAAELLVCEEANESLAGYLLQRRLGRPRITLKLATSLDGCIAMPSGESRWITGEPARDHCHAMRAKADAILVGGGTFRDDSPRLDVRLPGLAARGPERWVLTRGKTPDPGPETGPDGWRALPSPQAVTTMSTIQDLLVEGGAGAAAAFLRADLVDRLLVYRAPLLIGGGLPAISDIGLGSLNAAHGRWRQIDSRRLGSDTLEVYTRMRCSPA